MTLPAPWRGAVIERQHSILVDAYAEIISGMSPDEQVALSSENAEKVFGLTEA